MSTEEYLGRNTTAYYDVLARTGGGRWSPERSTAEWIEFILTAHYRQARTVQGRLWRGDRVAEQVDDLIETGLAPDRAAPALELTFSSWSLRNATYRELTEVTPTTASRDLAALVASGILQRHGNKKGSWYSPADTYRAWLTELREQTKAAFDASADPYRLAGRGQEIPVGPAAS